MKSDPSPTLHHQNHTMSNGRHSAEYLWKLDLKFSNNQSYMFLFSWAFFFSNEVIAVYPVANINLLLFRRNCYSHLLSWQRKETFRNEKNNEETWNLVPINDFFSCWQKTNLALFLEVNKSLSPSNSFITQTKDLITSTSDHISVMRLVRM